MKKSGFTLIELLVVIVIIGVLFAVALPVFENAGKKDTDRAAQQVMNVLRMARQHAIAKRQWTLVVFPNANADYSDNVKDINNLDKCLRSYAVLAVTNNVDGQGNWGKSGRGTGDWRDPSPDSMQFEFLTEWKTLPNGMYFDDTPNPNKNQGGLQGNYLFANIASDPYCLGKFKYPWNPEKPNSKDAEMSAILFKPNGRSFCIYEYADQTKNPPKGKFWQDKEGVRLYVTSAKMYQPDGTSLDEGHPLPGGTNTVIEIQNKTGQMILLSEGQLYDD